MPNASRHTRQPLGVILNGGLGTRLRPITPGLPKALVPVLNRPLIDYSIEYLVRLGLREIAIVVSPGDQESARRAVAVAPAGVALHVVVQFEANGIGAAVSCVGPLLDERVVVVLAADTLLIGDTGDHLGAFTASSAGAGLVLAPVPDPRSFGVAVLDGARVVELEEKPEIPRSNLALVGLWLLAASAVERVRTNPVINSKGESDLTATVAELLAEQHEVLGWVTDGEWLDAGTVEGFLLTHRRMLLDLESCGQFDQGNNCHVTGVLAVGERVSAVGSRLDGPVLLGAGVRLSDAEVRDSVVCDGATVEQARLERCVVLPGAHVRGGHYRDVVITAAGDVGGPGAASVVLPAAFRERLAGA